MIPGRVLAAATVQAALVAIAIVWRHVDHGSAWHDGAPLGGTHAIAVPLALSVGALVGVASVYASHTLVRTTAWGRRMHTTLREGLLGLTRDATSLAVLAAATAIGEEALFRGAALPAMVPYVGTVGAVAVSSAAFGVLHVPSSRRLLPWTATACVMGVVFALLYLATGEVLAPIAAHAVINYENLQFLLAHDLADPTVDGERAATA